MAKAKLTEAAQAWVKKPTAREKAQAKPAGAKPKKHTIYLSDRASKLVWKQRIDTGVPVSRTIEDLILKNLG